MTSAKTFCVKCCVTVTVTAADGYKCPLCHFDAIGHAGMAKRDDRQAAVFAWAKVAFSVEQSTSLPQRGLRLLEEAIETYQACGGDMITARRLVDFVFHRPPGEIGQELGGVGVTVLALAAAAGLSADTEEQREVSRVLSNPIGEFAARNKAKNDAGFLLVKVEPK